ncbi:MAG: heavy-metal-associated domain-containing protein [Actinobacteria bacterium]|nr:heavy-metal-associated domain-containing protein [Actinomycetota bacterium]
MSTATKGPLAVELPVTGLDRSGGPALERALQSVAGVETARVNVRAGRVRISYDPAVASLGSLVQAVPQAGYDTGSASLRLKVEGLYGAGVRRHHRGCPQGHSRRAGRQPERRHRGDEG